VDGDRARGHPGGRAVRPPRPGAPPVNLTKTIDASAQLPPAIRTTLQRSCYDCHSNKTSWPWYAQVFPINWWLQDHVTSARRHVNFSTWAGYTQKQKLKKLDQICEEVNQRDMPLKVYVPMHPRAKLSPADRDAICEWANAERTRVAVTPQAQLQASAKR
jgi:hypothetical protein